MNGIIDNQDDSLEITALCYMRPDNKVSNGAKDDATHDDDGIDFNVDFDNGGNRVGQVWFTASEGLAFGIRPQHVFDVSAGEAVKDIVRIFAIPETPDLQKDYVLLLNYGIYNADPDKSVSWLRDKITVRVVREFGAPDYFKAARAYIVGNKTSFFTEEKQYNKEAIRIVVMRQEGLKMTALETYWNKPELKGIDAVVAKYPTQSVVINGNFVDAVVGSTVHLGGQSTKCVGRLISGGAKSVASMDAQSIAEYTTDKLRYIAQDATGTFTFGSGEVPDPKFREAMGGLLPANTKCTKSREDKFTQVLGQAPVFSWKMIFTMTTNTEKEHDTSNGNGSVGSYADALSSKATDILVLDGGSSVALAYKDPNGQLTTKFKGDKHIPNTYQYYINTYFMFEGK